jgi:hypothetical protein
MKISTLADVDLSKYKLAYFYGNSTGSYKLCQDDVMRLADSGKVIEDLNLVIALIPKEARLQDCGGDDWNDCPAECNASGFYRYPEGTIFLEGNLGEELRLKKD